MSKDDKSVLVINAGSSSVKLAVYGYEPEEGLKTLYRGLVEGIGSSPKFILKDGDGVTLRERQLRDGQDNYGACFDELAGLLEGMLPEQGPDAIGHRVVHGGAEYSAPVVINGDVAARLASFVKLAPLHQPYNLMGIESLGGAYPDAVQVACFDTSFHLTQPVTARMFGLPLRYYESGVQRYGFHGLSYEYIAMRLGEVDPAAAAGRVVTAHLGAGASLCAMRNSRSAATTMGFTALDGMPMATRSGGIDPGIIFHLVREGMAVGEVEKLLLKDSGLLGISGISADMRALEESGDSNARLAIDYFVYRAVRETGSLAAAIGGLDALVFTAGIGENSARVREGICAGLGWLGVEIDEKSNAANEILISKPGSGKPVYVIPTNEELVIAMHTLKKIGG